MICKYCGAKVSPSNAVCSKCGSPVMTNGGNGFWDILGGQKTDTASDSAPATKATESVEHKDNSKKNAMICAAVSVICLLAAVIGISSGSRRIARITASYEQRLAQLEEVIAEKDRSLSEKDQLFAEQEIISEEPSAMPENPTQENAPIIVVMHQLSDQTKVLGYKGYEDEYLFMFRIMGQLRQFEWQKAVDDPKDGSLTWEIISFDEQGRNEALGIRRKESVNNGFTILIAEGLTEESAGLYRCVATDYQGNESESTANLWITFPEAVDTPYPQAAETEDQSFLQPDLSEEPEPDTTVWRNDQAIINGAEPPSERPYPPRPRETGNGS